MVRAFLAQEGITRSALYAYITELVLWKAGIRLQLYTAIRAFKGGDCNTTRKK